MEALVAFLRAALDEDERVIAGACIHIEDCNGSGYGARFDDDRVLAEVEAKRRILDAVDGDDPFGPWDGCGDGCDWKAINWAVRVLAQVYAARPGFKDEWRLT